MRDVRRSLVASRFCFSSDEDEDDAASFFLDAFEVSAPASLFDRRQLLCFAALAKDFFDKDGGSLLIDTS